MSHLDTDSLTLLALGEDADDDRHLADCDSCQVELAELRRVVTVGRSIDPHEAIPDPPAHVWAGVAAELGLDGAPEQNVSLAAQREHRRPRSRRSLAAALAAAACVAALAVATVVVANRQPDVLVEAALAPLDGSGVQGTAGLVQAGDGFALLLDLGELPEADGYYELWLLADDGQRLVSLGPLTDEAVHPLPVGLPPGDFPVVDVSAEGFDGDPTHSGQSLARGRLPL